MSTPSDRDDHRDIEVALRRFRAPFARIEKLMQQVHAIGRAVTNEIDPIVSKVRQIERQWAPVLARVAARLEQLPEVERRGIRNMAQRGWYMDAGQPLALLWQFGDATTDADFSALEAKLTDDICSRLDEIESNLCERLPHRRHLIAPAFDAHRDAQYALSIPALLAQADGVSSELIGEQLYSRVPGQPARTRVASKLEARFVGQASEVLVSPLLGPTPLIENVSERAAAGRDPELNRHQIMHGESLDFPTRQNSARAVALLAYVSWVLDPDVLNDLDVDEVAE